MRRFGFSLVGRSRALHLATTPGATLRVAGAGCAKLTVKTNMETYVASVEAANADGTPYEAIPHAPSAIAASQHLANLFVASARASTHAFATPEAEQAALFYNFAPTSTTPEFEQTYFLHL